MCKMTVLRQPVSGERTQQIPTDRENSSSEKTNVAPERDAPLDLDSVLILIQSYKSPFPSGKRVSLVLPSKQS